MKRYDSTTPWTQAPEIATPARQASLAADVGVPALQSLITGALTGTLFTFATYQLAPNLDASPLAVWAGSSLTMAAGAWLYLLKETRDLLWSTETRLGHDLDGDGEVGKPARSLPIILNGAKIKRAAEQRQRQEEQDEFAAFVRLLPVYGTAVRAWEPQIGREDYIRYRDFLLEHGLARWNSVKPDGTPNETKGWELTTPYDVIIKALEAD